MRNALVLGSLVCLGAAAGAHAAPTLHVRGAAARVVIVPESRSDIAVTILHANPHLPLRVSKFGDTVTVQGDIAHRAHVCHSILGRRSVAVWGRGDIPYDALPQVVVHSPMSVRATAGDAVFGAIGRSEALDFANRGCGDWEIANVRGHMRLSVAGSGDARAGGAGSAELSIAGSGDIGARDIRNGLVATSTGSGDISAASVTGPLSVQIAGSGEVHVPSGQVTALTVQVAGSGDLLFGGVAGSLQASVAGSGDIKVAEVMGPVTKRVFGSGDVTITHQNFARR